MDICSWVEANRHNVFSVSVYKKMFTPYEQDNRFMDESVYADTNDVRFIEAIDIGKGDWLIGCEMVEEEYGGTYKDIGIRRYYRLSDISISMYRDEE